MRRKRPKAPARMFASGTWLPPGRETCFCCRASTVKFLETLGFRLSISASGSCPLLTCRPYPTIYRRRRPRHENGQDRERFQMEAGNIAGLCRELVWRIPSRHDADSPLPTEEVRVYTDTEQAVGDSKSAMAIQGGRERGLVLHKLMEEVLTDEITEDPSTLKQRAETLIRELGLMPSVDPAEGPNPSEMAARSHGHSPCRKWQPCATTWCQNAPFTPPRRGKARKLLLRELSTPLPLTLRANCNWLSTGRAMWRRMTPASPSIATKSATIWQQLEQGRG